MVVINEALMKAQWENTIREALKVDVIHTPITTRISNSGGQRIKTAGTPETIPNCVFFLQPPQYNQNEQGLYENRDALVYIDLTYTINKHDLIEYDNKVYLVNIVVPLGNSKFQITQRCDLLLQENE